MHDENRFKAAYQAPSKMQSQTSSNSTVAGVNTVYPSGTLRVCDGTDHWVYNSPSHSFHRSHEEASGCKPDFGDFSKITEDLVSAASIGRDHVEFAGAQRECELVRAEYSAAVPSEIPAASPSVRTLCIDRAQRLVLRDRVERGTGPGTRMVETTTYSRYERNTALPADLFQFQVPTGYFVDDGPQPDLLVENGVYRLSAQIAPPDLISKVEPESTAEAVQAAVFGIVLVSFQVTAEGNPVKLKVVRGLGHGLDEKATEAVSQWHFRPGMKDGVPVAVGPLTAAVSFRRP